MQQVPFPPLSEQIYQILDHDPTVKYELDGIIKKLKSTPQKREVIKTINQLISEKKIIKIENATSGKKEYKTSAFVPENVSQSNEIKYLFIDLQQQDTSLIKELEKKCWKKLKVFGCATLDYTGYGPRVATTDNFRIIQHKFSESTIQLSWLVQETINKCDPTNIHILLVGPNKENLNVIAELVRSRGFKVSINKNIEKWLLE